MGAENVGEAPLKWSLADSCDSLSEGSREPEVIRLVKRAFLPRKSRNKENMLGFVSGCRDLLQRLELRNQKVIRRASPFAFNFHQTYVFRTRETMASQQEEASAAEAQQADGMEVEQEETTLEESAVEKAEVAEGGGEGSAPELQAKMEEEQEGSGPAGADAGQAGGAAGEAKEGEEESAAPRVGEDAGEAASSDALQAQASEDNAGGV